MRRGSACPFRAAWPFPGGAHRLSAFPKDQDGISMLRGINKIGQSWVGKAIVAVLFGFLIISFAIWGIGDIFRGAVRTDVASVGSVGISADAYRTAYQTEVQRLARQTRQSISPDRAR